MPLPMPYSIKAFHEGIAYGRQVTGRVRFRQRRDTRGHATGHATGERETLISSGRAAHFGRR
jgi:hypothetical protein